MRKFTNLLIALALLIIGVGEVNAEAKTYWEPSSAFGANWDGATNTASWSKNDNGWYILYTGFTPAVQNNSTEINLLEKYIKMHFNVTSITGADNLQLKIKSTGKDEKTITLATGETDIVFADYSDVDFSKVTEITLWGTLSDENESGSAVIDECYLLTNDRWEYQTQQQTVSSYALGSALSLNSVISDNTLVSIATGDNILYGTHQDNQIYAKTIEEAMGIVDEKGANESTYRFRISQSTDAGVTMPEGVTTLYKIRAYKGDGSNNYTGPWGGDGFVTDLGWTYNVHSSENGNACYYDITPIEGKTNTYKITSYKKDGTKVRQLFQSQNWNPEEWTFNVVTITQTTKDIEVLVEIQGEDTEDPGVPDVKDGWISLITNGKLDGDDVTNFWTKNEDGGAVAAVIDATCGRNGGPGIKVVTKDNAGTDWGTQFFVKSSTPLKEGQKLHIEFDYRADRPQEAATQVHRNPGDYNANIDNVQFTVNWKHYSNEFTITAGMCKQDGNEGDFYMQSFGLNLSQIRSTSNFYFDNIVMWTEDDPLKPLKVALQNAIAQGDLQNGFAKTTDSFSALTSAIDDGRKALNDAGATETSLTNAATAITSAISGLELEDGYTKLTKEMYYNWDSATAPTSGSPNAGACDYVIGVSTSQPYGNVSVPLLTFADLSTFDNLYVLATGGTPRILLNRDIDNGQCRATESESHLIDNTNDNCMTWASGYFTTEGSNVTVDLKQLAANKGFAHLHTIKTVGGNVTVSDMLLYRSLTVGSAGMATFGTLYKTANLSGATNVYAVKLVDGKVQKTAIDSKNVPAGVGVLVEGSGEIVPTFDVEAGSVESDLKVSNGTVSGSGIYVLANGTHGVGFYLLDSNVKVPAGKAYLEIPAAGREFIGFADDATGIKTIETAKANDAIYNLAGQQVKKAQKGVYIINGKKAIMK